MILYMNRRDVPNLDRGELPSAVIDYVIGKANKYERRCRALYGRYIVFHSFTVEMKRMMCGRRPTMPSIS